MEIKTCLREEIVTKCKEGLAFYQFTSRTQRTLIPGVKRLVSYMKTNMLEVYNRSVGEKFIEFEVGSNMLSSGQLERDIRIIFLFNLMLEGKEYRVRSESHFYCFPGEIGKIAEEFATSISTQLRFRQGTIISYRSSLSNFSVLMDMEKIRLKDLNRNVIMKFVSSMRNTRSYVIVPLRKFLKYLFEENLVATDYSELLAGFKKHDKEKLPSFYTKEEIIKIERSITRESGIGKRNYAMILLATRLGLRASDIANLKFSDIDWENSIIKIIQNKTGREIELPVIAEIGNAIIDYIKNGRPKSNLKNIFLSARHPVRTLNGQSFTATVNRCMSAAGVDISYRHHGSHSLRHSLATNLMNNGVTFPIISETLGHYTTDSTMIYLGVNIKSLIECSLDVIKVSDNFYDQKGGYFYE